MEDSHANCYCVPDFHGDLCQYQYDECQLGPRYILLKFSSNSLHFCCCCRCMNGGTCIDGVDNFTCSCPPKLTGVFCECLIIDSATLDCSYISPTPYSSTTTPFPITKSITTTTERFTTLETVISEITEVPNTSSTIYYNNETITASISYPRTIISSLSTESSSGSSDTTVSEITTSNILEENVTTSQVIHTTIPPNVPQITTTVSTLQTTSSTEETTTEELYSTEVTTKPYDSTSVTTQLAARTLESSAATTTMGTTELHTIPIILTTNMSQFSTTTASEETTFQYLTEETTLYSSIAPFLTDVPTTTEEIVSSTYIIPEINQTTTIGIPDCGRGEMLCQNGGTCIYTTEGYRVST